MNITILKNENDVAKAVAEEIESVITKKPDALICLCAGHSPVLVLKQLVIDARKNKYPHDKFKFVSLDEWVGLGIHNAGSCRHDISLHFLAPLAIAGEERMFFFDGLSKDLNEECKEARRYIEKNGGIDLVLLGIGMNGHIGFNEPGTLVSDGIRVVELSETSKSVGTKYFDRAHNLTKGITIGIKEILEAKKVMVMASGAHKQDIVERSVRGVADKDCPVTLIREHSDIHMYFDKEAAKKIK